VNVSHDERRDQRRGEKRRDQADAEFAVFDARVHDDGADGEELQQARYVPAGDQTLRTTDKYFVLVTDIFILFFCPPKFSLTLFAAVL